MSKGYKECPSHDFTTATIIISVFPLLGNSKLLPMGDSFPNICLAILSVIAICLSPSCKRLSPSITVILNTEIKLESTSNCHV